MATYPIPLGTRRLRSARTALSIWADRWVPRLVLSPSIAASLVFVYVFMLVTGYLSLTASTFMPRYEYVGFARYRDLFANDIWWTSVRNLALFGVPFIVICVAVGLLLAILLDQRIRYEGALRAIYLYPLALSQIVAGTAWQWILNPALGVEQSIRNLGWQSFSFGWLGDSDKAIYCVVIAAGWQCTGFVTALFLAGLRGIDEEVVKAAQVDGANLPMIYRRVIIPSMGPVFLSVFLILSHLAVKTFDLVVALTAGGPGTSSYLPAMFMYTLSFERSRLGIGAASSMMMLAMVIAILVPLMYLGGRGNRDAA